MRATRVGVVADTHCPEFVERLPGGIAELLAGVDLILHAGDISSLDTLAELARIAPVEAVRGDHDSGLDLPDRRIVEVAGRRIGLLHGNRSHLIEEPATFAGTISLGYWWPSGGLDRHLLRTFPAVDAVVYGHTHSAAVRRVGGTLLFNPGAVYQVTPEEARRRLARRPRWFERSWLEVMRYRRVWPRPSVGLLEIGPDGIVASVLPLPG
ncbi:MAG: metallophosphatase family protein [Candidatus Dormibacteraeota bacterium]|nr:metallophosphatase family protein [Candidatus Dormibacteraeota bacterium]